MKLGFYLCHIIFIFTELASVSDELLVAKSFRPLLHRIRVPCDDIFGVHVVVHVFIVF